MDVARPYTAISPSLDGEVLRVLSATSMPLTGREVATRTGRASHSGVLRVLNRLAEQGLATRVELNHSHLYSLNREHLAAPAVAVMAGMRQELLRRIGDVIRSWQIAPVHASMFGSAARGDGDTDSDIDLVVVRASDVDPEDELWESQVDDLRNRITAWTGNFASIVEIDVDGLKQIRDEGRRIVDELRSDAICLFGPEMESLLDGL